MKSLRTRRLPSLLTAATLGLAAAACATPPAVPVAVQTAPAVKPVLTEDKADAAKVALGAYVARVLPGKTVEDTAVTKAVLKDARTFDEGHHHETWNLTVEIDGGRLATFALKIFPDAARAEHENFLA